MAIIGRYQKQPYDVDDYDITWEDYFDGRSDAISTISASATPSGLTIVGTSFTGVNSKVLCGGGVDGETYVVEVEMQTTSSRRKQVEFTVKVKED